MKKNISTYVKALVLALITVAGVSFASAWTGPGAVAPNGNVAAPLNVGTSMQVKEGPLQINHANGSTPGLEVLGNIQMVTSKAAIGSVLVSDANGIADWMATSSLGIIGTAASIKATGYVRWNETISQNPPILYYLDAKGTGRLSIAFGSVVINCSDGSAMVDTIEAIGYNTSGETITHKGYCTKMVYP